MLRNQRAQSSNTRCIVMSNLDKISCCLCLDVLNDPVTTACGHSYCRSCIKDHWDTEDQRGVYSCPQCRERFRQRPDLEKNTMLAGLVEDMKKNGFQSVQLSKKLQGSQLNIKQRIQQRERDVKLLKQEVEAINSSADEAVENSEKIFTELIRVLEQRRSEVKQQVRSQQQTEVSRVRELQEKLEKEITELKRKDQELEKLSHTQDHNQFQQDDPSLSQLREALDSSSISERPRSYFEAVTAAVSELREKLQDVLRGTWTNISEAQADVLLSEPEPRTRAEFIRYSRDITLDPNTAYRRLLLSDGDRKVTLMSKDQPYSDHPDRFTYYDQVLSKESLTGRCYWEVELGGKVFVAVSFKTIRRDGRSTECGFGNNNKSWSLSCFTDRYDFWYNNVHTAVSGPLSSRVGVYLDHSAGILSFYSVSETMTLLHRVQTTFPEPLHAGLRIYSYLSVGNSAELCKLRHKSFI